MSGNALRPGLSAQSRHVVAHVDTADAVGSGSLPVLATPRLISWLEAASCAAIAACCADGSSSVGTRLAFEHLKPSSVGAAVTCTATLVHVDGRLLRFELVATDVHDVAVAHGEVTRVIVDDARFLARATAG